MGDELRAGNEMEQQQRCCGGQEQALQKQPRTSTTLPKQEKEQSEQFDDADDAQPGRREAKPAGGLI